MELKNRIGLLLILFSCLISFSAKAESDSSKTGNYVIYFTDKDGTPFDINHPEEFVSQRAIERRKRLNIPFDYSDLPVSPEYKNTISQTEGVRVLYYSKWFNNATVTLDTSVISTAKILEYPFVKSIQYIGRTSKKTISDTAKINKSRAKLKESQDAIREEYLNIPDAGNEYKYGLGTSQIQMLAGDIVHKLGYQGKGIMIAVFDAGFKNADLLPVFDSIFQNKQIIDTRDFSEFDTSVWNGDSHGTNVLSCIASYMPGIFTGTAPKSNFVLVRTETTGSETVTEETNWATAAEYADSIGVDIITSSLGYTTFDDKELSHKYNDMDGNTAIITKAADKAYEKGILVLNSAGNEGYSKWKYIGAPSDGKNVIASGGVDIGMSPSFFSSRGPSFDKRIKPDISALASNTIVCEANGFIGPSNGTSFSNPILAGMMATMLQAAPDRSLDEIKQAVITSSSHFANPNSAYGYGVPDFEMALAYLKKHPFFNYERSNVFETNYKRGLSIMTLRIYSATDQKVTVYYKKLKKNGKSKVIKKFKFDLTEGEFYSTPILIDYVTKHKMKEGSYLIQVKSKDIHYERSMSVSSSK